MTLKLGGTATPEPSSQLLDDALSTIAAMLAAAAESGPILEVLAEIEQCRTHLNAGAQAEVFEPLARACFESIRNLAAQAGVLGTDQRTQIANLLATIRETVSAVSGNEDSLQHTLVESAERFERIATVGTLQEMQALLVNEVSTLRRVAAERRALWEQTTEQFRTRLAHLESRLDHTRREAAADPLTNIANRRAFDEALRARLQPSQPSFVMAMIDIDDFKLINDRCGHATGDQVLVAVATALTGNLRKDDLVARLGGDEFAVLATGMALRQAESLFAAVGRHVRNACRLLVHDGMTSTISIGLAECSAGETADSLQRRADMALYDAKRAGKGRVAVRESPSIRDLLNAPSHRRRP